MTEPIYWGYGRANKATHRPGDEVNPDTYKLRHYLEDVKKWTKGLPEEMSTKSSIWHSGEYIDGVAHFHLYWEMQDRQIHLDYRDDVGNWTDIILPQPLLEALQNDLNRVQKASTKEQARDVS